MAKTEHSFQSHDEKTIVYFKHLPEKQSKSVLIITHGMVEHAQRYDAFAAFLNQHSVAVYAHDQRGHGKTAGIPENVGHFDDINGWQKVTDDLQELILLVKREHPSLPVFILGQSMGSFIVRTYISKYSDEIQGVILNATTGSAGLLGIAGIILSGIIKRFKNKKSPSPLFNNMSFGSYNNAFKPNRTDFDWLSRDENVVDKYIADPFCGNICSIGFFNELIKGLEHINKLKTAKQVRKDLRMRLFSGSKDPLSKNGKQVREVFELYKKAGIKDIEMKLYPEARHEILNEMNKEEVYNDILSFLNKH